MVATYLIAHGSCSMISFTPIIRNLGGVIFALLLVANSSASIIVDADLFFSECTKGYVSVVEDTTVSGSAKFDGRCTIALASATLNLTFLDVNLTIQELVVNGASDGGGGKIHFLRSQVFATQGGVLVLSQNQPGGIDLLIEDTELDAATYIAMYTDRVNFMLDHATLRASESVTLSVDVGSLTIKHSVVGADTDNITLISGFDGLQIDRSELFAPLGGLRVQSFAPIAIEDSVAETQHFLVLRARRSSVELLRSKLQSQQGTIEVIGGEGAGTIHDTFLQTGKGNVFVSSGRASAEIQRSRLTTLSGKIKVEAMRDVTVADSRVSTNDGPVEFFGFEALTVTDNEVAATNDVAMTARTGSAIVDHNIFKASHLNLVVPEGECTSELNIPELSCNVQ